jgi:putative transcriptional regulator
MKQMSTLPTNLTPEEVEALSESPLTREDLLRMPRKPRAIIIRKTLGLTQEEFAARYHIPLGTLRDWEQGRTEPDAPARAYLRVIAVEPEITARAMR